MTRKCRCLHWPRFHGAVQGSLDEPATGCYLCECKRYVPKPWWRR